ncbi:hypothetical protein GQX74_010140 [Glossina fuscipes]|nr:hypothetical protein GQX74_010140 [Glossina fuscipes]
MEWIEKASPELIILHFHIIVNYDSYQWRLTRGPNVIITLQIIVNYVNYKILIHVIPILFLINQYFVICFGMPSNQDDRLSIHPDYHTILNYESPGQASKLWSLPLITIEENTFFVGSGVFKEEKILITVVL